MKRLVLLCLFLSACGGGGGGAAPATPIAQSSASNVVSLYAAPASSNVNILLASATICSPGTSTCQTINNLLVDTGSYGIRILKSALNIPLAQVNGTGGAPLSECATFAAGYTWGNVAHADFKMAGEVASNLPIQVIDDSAAPNPAVPAGCTGASIGNASSIGANGIIGIGIFSYDCGQYCASSSGNNIYYECTSSGCVSLAEPYGLQVKNPVSSFATDNNGILITLPQIPATGAPSVTGSLIFGIGTQSNNSPGQATAIPLDASGNFTTVLNGLSFSSSFMDSGSNMMLFRDGTMPICAGGLGYCPASTQQLSAILKNTAAGSPSVPVSFSVANTTALVQNGNAVYNNLAGSATDPTTFDWGLPFFFGRTIYFAISGANTPAGTGPYVAF